MDLLAFSPPVTLTRVFAANTGAVFTLIWILNHFKRFRGPDRTDKFIQSEKYLQEGIAEVLKESLDFHNMMSNLESGLDNYLEEFEYKSSVWPDVKRALEDFNYKLRWQLDHKIATYLQMSLHSIYETIEFYPKVYGLVHDLVTSKPALMKKKDDFVGRFLNQSNAMDSQLSNYDKIVNNAFNNISISLKQKGRFLLLSSNFEKDSHNKFNPKDLELVHSLFVKLDHAKELKEKNYYSIKRFLRGWMIDMYYFMTGSGGSYYDEETKIVLRMKLEIPSAIRVKKESLEQYTASLTELSRRINDKRKRTFMAFRRTSMELLSALKTVEDLSTEAGKVLHYFQYLK